MGANGSANNLEAGSGNSPRIFLSAFAEKTRTSVLYFILEQDVVNISKAQGVCGRAHGREAGDGAGRNRGGAGETVGGEGLRQGVCCPGAVPGAEEGRGTLPGLVERHVWG